MGSKSPPPHLRGGSQHHNRCCTRKAVFVWSFAIFAVSLLLVNLSFASGYRSMQLGTYMLLSPGKLRNVLELDNKLSTSLPLELSADAESLDPPLNATAMAELAVKEAQQKAAEVVDPLAQPRSSKLSQGGGRPVGDPVKRDSTGSTLVVYVFQNRDDDSVRNFEYFLENGMVEDPQVDFVLIVQHLQPVWWGGGGGGGYMVCS